MWAQKAKELPRSVGPVSRVGNVRAVGEAQGLTKSSLVRLEELLKLVLFIACWKRSEVMPETRRVSEARVAVEFSRNS